MTAMRICSSLWLALALVWLVTALSTKQTQERAEIASRTTLGIPVVLGFYLIFGKRFFGWLHFSVVPHNLLIDSLGVGLTAVGIAFAIWARFAIGRNWSAAVSIKVEHQLIRNGPYAWVRHPIYSGVLVGVLGTALVNGEVRGLLGVVLLWLGLWMKSRLEEQFMLKTFGPEYEEYSRSTGALIPRLRRP